MENRCAAAQKRVAGMGVLTPSQRCHDYNSGVHENRERQPKGGIFAMLSSAIEPPQAAEDCQDFEALRGPQDCYRLWSSHWWSSDRDRHVLLIGLYPEVPLKAPTSSERRLAERLGCTGIIKVNVCDLRAADLDAIRDAGIVACSGLNRSSIVELAGDAAAVVVCWDAVPEPLSGFVERVLSDLRAVGIKPIYPLHG